MNATEQRLVRKINRLFLPFLYLIQYFQFSDRTTINSAVALGFYEDTRITQSQLGWLGAIVFAGHLAFQIPNTYLLHKIPISKYFGVTIVLWGLAESLLVLTSRFEVMMVLRLLLGLTEAPASPILLLLISMLYRRSEQVFLTGTMMFSNAVAGILNGIIAYGIRRMAGLAGLAAWRWQVGQTIFFEPEKSRCMLLYGSFTILIGVLAFLFLPDTAYSRWFRLTEEEREITDERIRDNAGVESHKVKLSHIKEALGESRFYCYALIAFMVMTQNGCMVTFSTQIVITMGYSSDTALLISSCQGIVWLMYIIGGVWLSRKIGLSHVGALSCLSCMLSALLLLLIPEGPVKLTGIFLFSVSTTAIMLMTCISNDVAGFTKKTVYMAMFVTMVSLGNFIGPLMMVESEAPRFVSAMVAYALFQGFSAVLFEYSRWSMARMNRFKLDQLLKQDDPRCSEIDVDPQSNREKLDLTDREDGRFLYRL
ncbi:major facilitator superfamily domain-containing protein [Dichotomocladium elegans]|nr:major facilitator superfamily domain-containing protein [Dichotomocladium elegans]